MTWTAKGLVHCGDVYPISTQPQATGHDKASTSLPSDTIQVDYFILTFLLCNSSSANAIASCSSDAAASSKLVHTLPVNVSMHPFTSCASAGAVIT
jgi:hypothetical protein